MRCLDREALIPLSWQGDGVRRSPQLFPDVTGSAVIVFPGGTSCPSLSLRVIPMSHRSREPI